MPLLPRLSAVSVLSALSLLPACRPAPTADLVAFGRVWTGDAERPWAGGVAVAGDTIVAVGDSAEVAALVGSGTRVLQNGAGMVTPGFIDSHLHLMESGYSLASIQLRDAASPEEFIARIKAHAAALPPGTWILDGNWDHQNWPGAPLPSREWIDSVTPAHPVFVNRLDGHIWLANSLALQAGGITRATPPIAGGTIDRDRRTGEPTGILRDNAHNPVQAAIPAPPPEQDDSALARVMAYANARGVTTAVSVSSTWRELAGLRRARAAGRLTLRVAVFDTLRDWRRVADTVQAHGMGDDWIWLAGVKGYVDGALGSGTALFFEPYTDEPANRGLMVADPDSLAAWVAAADSAGLQVAMHAIGERANSFILGLFDSLARAHGPRDRRFRVEHAQHLRREDIARMTDMGVIASMQPYHAIDDGRWAEGRIGPDRIRTTYAFRSLLNRGGHVAFGSDFSVAPIEPLFGIYAAVTRRTIDGAHPEGWVPGEKIGVEEALRSYTYEGAYGIFAEERRGMLRPGYLADLVLLEQDLTRIPPADLERARVRATVVGGQVVYEAGRAP